MIQGAAAFTLVPRLREAATAEARRHLLLREAGLMLVVMLAGSVMIWLLAPPIARLMLRGRYELTAALMIATIVSGVLKVVSAFAVSVASTLAPPGSLRLLGLSSWACVGVGIGAAFAFKGFGLVGVLYGVSLGWGGSLPDRRVAVVASTCAGPRSAGRGNAAASRSSNQRRARMLRSAASVTAPPRAQRASVRGSTGFRVYGGQGIADRSQPVQEIGGVPTRRAQQLRHEFEHQHLRQLRTQPAITNGSAPSTSIFASRGLTPSSASTASPRRMRTRIACSSPTPRTSLVLRRRDYPRTRTASRPSTRRRARPRSR